MKPVYIISTESFCGKTGLCASLALKARERNLKVGYMKPIGTQPMRVDGRLVDEDCYSLHEALGLDGEVESMSPVMLTPQFIHAHLARARTNCPAKLIEAFQDYSQGKDLVVLEGMSHLHEGRWLGLAPRQITKLLHASAILLVKFEHELVIDEILAAKDVLGQSLAGVILNWVPESKLPLINNAVVPFLTDQGVTVLGAVPRNQRMLAVSVAELVECLDGRVVAGHEGTGQLVETFMVGAMGRDKALELFRQKGNKAVITGGDREDVQLVALETPTRALVLTGDHDPTRKVIENADEAGVPVVVVDMDTMSAVERTEGMVGRIRVHDKDRVERMQAMVSRSVDLDRILDGLEP